MGAPVPVPIVIKRLQGELKKIEKAGLPEGVLSAKPKETDMQEWSATIDGPQDSPYEGGKFHLKVIFPNNYPHAPPLVTFTTKIFHMNISTAGYICLSILKKEEWAAATSIPTLLVAVRSLLGSPNPDDPLIPSIAALSLNDKVKYEATVKKWVQRYAAN